MKIRSTVRIVLLLVTLLPAVVCAQTAPANDGEGELRALLALKGDPDRGKTVFVQCQDCHRKDGSGRANGVFPRLSGQHASVLIKQLSDIRSGRRNNPAMQPIVAEPNLSVGDIANVAAYVQGLPISANNGKGPGTEVARGKQLYERDCATCHGAAGEGDAARFHPMVATQHYLYLLRELVSIRDGERRNSSADMVKLIKPYRAAEIEAVADYMSRLAPPKR